MSLYSLRYLRNWLGDVYVHVWPESQSIVEQIETDKRLNVTMVPRSPEYRGKNDQFIDKIKVMQDAPTPVAMYLDADTAVNKKIDDIFSEANKASFVATQFNDWLTNGGGIRRRIEWLIGRETINQDAVAKVTANPFPSVNGGVFACERTSPVLPLWHEWTMSVNDIFIADETVLHSLLGEFDGTGHIRVLKGGAWNCSPKHQPRNLKDRDVVIRHFHGDSNLRPNKSQKGVDLWWPMFRVACRQNLGGINDWLDQVNNRHLRSLMKEIENGNQVIGLVR